MDKDIYGGVADSRPLRRHNPTLGGKRKRETSQMRRKKENKEEEGDEEEDMEEEKEEEQSAVCHPLDSWLLQQRHDFEQSGLQALN